MGTVKTSKSVKLVIAMLAKNKKLFHDIEVFFTKDFGEIDYRSPLIPFKHTDYYKKEMGYPLKRRFISFKILIHPEAIIDIKLATNLLEEKLSINKKGVLQRRINIDPGYISDSKFILTTTKDYFHRIYLNKGIYAEVTLIWKKGSFHPFEWTYPDYKTAEYIDILDNMRKIYMQDIKKEI